MHSFENVSTFLIYIYDRNTQNFILHIHISVLAISFAIIVSADRPNFFLYVGPVFGVSLYMVNLREG